MEKVTDREKKEKVREEAARVLGYWTAIIILLGLTWAAFIRVLMWLF